MMTLLETRQTGSRPEYSNFLPYVLFEKDLNSDRETQVAEAAFTSPCGLFYDALQRGLYCCAFLSLIADDSEGHRIWVNPSWSFEYHRGLRSAGNFFLRWGDAHNERPSLYAPPDTPLT